MICPDLTYLDLHSSTRARRCCPVLSHPRTNEHHARPHPPTAPEPSSLRFLHFSPGRARCHSGTKQSILVCQLVSLPAALHCTAPYYCGRCRRGAFYQLSPALPCTHNYRQRRTHGITPIDHLPFSTHHSIYQSIDQSIASSQRHHCIARRHTTQDPYESATLRLDLL